MEKKLQKTYLTDCNLLKAQDLWQALSTLVSNLAERIHKLKCIMNMVKEKKYKMCGIKYKACECEFNLGHGNVKNDSTE